MELPITSNVLCRVLTYNFCLLLQMAKKVVIVNENNKRTIEEKGTIKDILGFDHASVKFDEK